MLASGRLGSWHAEVERPRRDGEHHTVTLRHEGKFLHIGIGRAFAGWRVLMLVAGKKGVLRQLSPMSRDVTERGE